MLHNLERFTRKFLLLACTLVTPLVTLTAVAGNAIYTTTKPGTQVNGNIYAQSTDVYIVVALRMAMRRGSPMGPITFR